MLFLLNFALTYYVTEIMPFVKLLPLLFITFSLHAFSQPGRLLLVGGGSEKNGASSWSTPAYRWAGEGKRVAIIGTSTGSLAPYFKQQCGATYAKEFAIASRDSANSQVLYDTLITYQVIFFRGGDQTEYYNLYRNTRLQAAVIHIYSKGGTICGTSAGMHILSSVVYTAANGTVYSYECIEDPNNKFVTLADDFMNFAPGFVFDTHVAERARFGRTVGFLANYKMNKGIDITGIGMDDMTCMTVDETGLATVRGTGCANISMPGSNYSLNGTKLLADKVHIMQLLQGCTYNFNTKQVTFNTLDKPTNSASYEETGNYTVLASGSNKLSENQAMLADLVINNGLTTDPVLIVTGDETLANTFRDKLLLLGTPEVKIAGINNDAGNSADIELKINNAVKILFLSNTTANFNQFLNTSNGGLLRQKAHAAGMICAFVGDDSRFAGRTVVDNFYTLYASYYAELTFSKGLSLLRHSVIMPNTFYNSDMYENSATAVPYAMALDTLKYGIWLTNHNYMKVTPVEGKNLLTGYGAAPIMVVSNEGTLTGFSSQTGSGSASTKPRMIAGFDNLELSMIDYTTPYTLGNVNITGVSASEIDKSSIISPNPVNDRLNFTSKGQNYNWEICSMDGRQIRFGHTESESTNLNIAYLKPGLYVFKTYHPGTHHLTSTKFIKK